jgi:hypothetical protein
VTLGHCEVLYVLFFLIFYSLFGPCPARTFIFPYLLLFIWPLPCPPFCFSLSFTLYLAPALLCKTDRQTDPALPPAPPCPVWPLVFPNPETRFPNPTVWAKSDFSNPTVQAGSITSIKTQNRRRTDRRTNTILALIYKMLGKKI